MDKFILRNPNKNTRYQSVNLRVEDYETLCQIKENFDIPLVDIISSMIKFCAARLEVKE